MTGVVALLAALLAIALLAASLARGSQSWDRAPRRRFASSCSMHAATCSTRVALRTCSMARDPLISLSHTKLCMTRKRNHSWTPQQHTFGMSMGVLRKEPTTASAQR